MIGNKRGRKPSTGKSKFAAEARAFWNDDDQALDDEANDSPIVSAHEQLNIPLKTNLPVQSGNLIDGSHIKKTKSINGSGDVDEITDNSLGPHATNVLEFCCCQGKSGIPACLNPLPQDAGLQHYCFANPCKPAKIFGGLCWYGSINSDFDFTSKSNLCLRCHPDNKPSFEEPNDNNLEFNDTLDDALVDYAAAAGGGQVEGIDGDNEQDNDGSREEEKALRIFSDLNGKFGKEFLVSANSIIPDYDRMSDLSIYESMDDIQRMYMYANQGEGGASFKLKSNSKNAPAENFEDLLHTQLMALVSCMAYDSLGINDDTSSKDVISNSQKKKELPNIALRIVNVVVKVRLASELQRYFGLLNGEPSLPASFIAYFQEKLKTKTIATTLLNTAMRVRRFINSSLNPLWLKNRPHSGFSDHKYMYLLRNLIFPVYVEKKALDCVRSRLKNSKETYDPTIAKHFTMFENIKKEYEFDRLWYPEGWLTFLLVGNPEVSPNIRLDMFTLDLNHAIVRNGSALAAMGSRARAESAQMRATLHAPPGLPRPSVRSASNSPDDQSINTVGHQTVTVNHNFGSSKTKSPLEALKKERETLIKMFSEKNASLNRLKSEMHKNSLLNVLPSHFDEFEKNSHEELLTELRGEIEAINRKISSNKNDSYNTPTL